MRATPDQSRKTCQLNSLDRRTNFRKALKAEVYTLSNESQFTKTPVIECSECGARVVLPYIATRGEQIGVMVLANGRQQRTFARVAWTSPLGTGGVVAGLEFLKPGTGVAC
jgi:PilZ domain